MKVEPYLFFEGRCEEAIEFYWRALGAELTMLMRYREGPQCPPGLEDKVMHAELRIGQSAVMVSDGHCEVPATFKGFALSISADDAAGAERLFAALSDGGQVRMPMGETFFSPRFGMVTDRFGVLWMVIATA